MEQRATFRPLVHLQANPWLASCGEQGALLSKRTSTAPLGGLWVLGVVMVGCAHQRFGSSPTAVPSRGIAHWQVVVVDRLGGLADAVERDVDRAEESQSEGKRSAASPISACELQWNRRLSRAGSKLPAAREMASVCHDRGAD